MELLNPIDWSVNPVLLTLLIALALMVSIQIYYIIFFFGRLMRKVIPNESQTLSPVSVIVCAHNELTNLQQLLPMLEEQDYPHYEVIVMDDRSTDGTSEWFESEMDRFKHIRMVRIDKEYAHVTPKKYAITTAVRSATHELILLTDADCRPQTDQWIKGMSACMTDDKGIVLGFSPYQRLSGFLNSLIRFETFYVAVQFLSFALAGRAYMGVGRNLMYRKSLFLVNKGFYTHLRVMGGDDDLLINEIATPTNTAVCLHPDTFMVSWPKETWRAWFHQKKRHLSVSKYYKSNIKRRLGLLTATHLGSWLVGVGLLVWAFLNWPQYALVVLIAGTLLLLRWLVQWIVLGVVSLRLYRIVGWAVIPIMDMVLTVYYLIMGIVMWRNRKKKITWNS